MLVNSLHDIWYEKSPKFARERDNGGYMQTGYLEQTKDCENKLTVQTQRENFQTNTS